MAAAGTLEVQLRNAQQQYERHLEELRRDCDRRVELMAQTHAAQLAAKQELAVAAAPAPAPAAVDVEEQLRQLRAQLGAQYQQELAREKRLLISTHDQHIDRLRAEHTAQLQRARADLDAELRQQVDSRLQAALAAATAAPASAPGTPSVGHMSRSVSLDMESGVNTEQLRRLKAQLESNHRDAVKKLMRQLEAAHQSQLDKLEAAHAQEIATLTAAVANSAIAAGDSGASGSSSAATAGPVMTQQARDASLMDEQMQSAAAQYEADLRAMAERFEEEKTRLQLDVAALQKHKGAHQLELHALAQKHTDEVHLPFKVHFFF